MSEERVVIVGGGVAGLCSAYYAAKSGFRVTVLDRRPAGHEGCSWGNAGMIVPSHFIPLAAPGMVALGLKWMWNPESPFYIKPALDAGLLSWAWKFARAATPEHVRKSAPLLRDLNQASRATFEEMERVDGMEFGLTRRGLLMLCKTERALEEESRVADQANALGVAAETLDAKGVAALEPDVTMDVAGAVYFPGDCHLTPGRFMRVLTERCRALGVEFLTETEVTGWRREGSKVRAALTSRGEVGGARFVLCGGAWSPETAAGLGLRLPMRAGKGYSLTLPSPRQLPKSCAILVEARVAVTPMDGALRFGGTMEIAGMDESVNPRRVRGIVKAVPRYYPAFAPEDFDGVAPWSGLRPCGPDGLPYLGPTKAAENVIVATGHAMMGLSLGPVTGKLVGELLRGEPPSIDLSALSPDRYA